MLRTPLEVARDQSITKPDFSLEGVKHAFHIKVRDADFPRDSIGNNRFEL